MRNGDILLAQPTLHASVVMLGCWLIKSCVYLTSALFNDDKVAGAQSGQSRCRMSHAVLTTTATCGNSMDDGGRLLAYMCSVCYLLRSIISR